jgi:hypothetical protein
MEDVGVSLVTLCYLGWIEAKEYVLQASHVTDGVGHSLPILGVMQKSPIEVGD